MKKNSATLILIVILLIAVFIFCFVDTDKTTNTNLTAQKASCPSVEEMEDAISLYKEGKIITNFQPELNAVYISQVAEKQLDYNAMQVLGYITACYSGYYKKNDLYWVEIYSQKTHKKLAKYSESYGFEMY